ncbi:MAG: T3SS effector HopA1 family protein [Bacteroidota bacterium]
MKSNGHLKDIESIVDAIEIKDDYSFSIFNKPIPVKHQQPYTQWNQPLHNFGQNLGDEDQMKVNLTNQLAGSIYNVFYCQGTSGEAGLEKSSQLENMPSKDDREAFMQTLSAANKTVDGYDYYWSVYAVDANGNSFVQKNGAYRNLTPMGFQFANQSDTKLNVGTMVHILIKKENKEVQPVFYHVYSQALMPQEAEFIRFYFNLKGEGAAPLIEAITTAFNKYKVPFLFKCLNHPDLYNRTDSAVLYLNKAQFKIGTRLLKPILDQIAPHLKTEVPLFSRKLRPGVSFAEDPGNGQSFGMSRCTALAQGIVNAYQKKLGDGKARRTEILRYLKNKGLEANRIFLKSNSQFPYDFTILQPN